MDGCRVRWSRQVGDGVDGFLVHGAFLFIASPEYLQAFDRHTGELRWASEMSDTEGSVRGAVIGEHLVLAPEWSDVQAFALSDGSSRDVGAVDRSGLPHLGAFDHLPDGYGFKDQVLSRAGREIWRTHGRLLPELGELGSLLVVNEMMTGVAVIDPTDGRIVLQAPLGTRNYPPTQVLVVDDDAYTMASDGTLYALRLEPGT